MLFLESYDEHWWDFINGWGHFGFCCRFINWLFTFIFDFYIDFSPLNWPLASHYSISKVTIKLTNVNDNTPFFLNGGPFIIAEVWLFNCLIYWFTDWLIDWHYHSISQSFILPISQGDFTGKRYKIGQITAYDNDTDAYHSVYGSLSYKFVNMSSKYSIDILLLFLIPIKGWITAR